MNANTLMHYRGRRWGRSTGALGADASAAGLEALHAAAAKCDLLIPYPFLGGFTRVGVRGQLQAYTGSSRMSRAWRMAHLGSYAVYACSRGRSVGHLGTRSLTTALNFVFDLWLDGRGPEWARSLGVYGSRDYFYWRVWTDLLAPAAGVVDPDKYLPPISRGVLEVGLVSRSANTRDSGVMRRMESAWEKSGVVLRYSRLFALVEEVFPKRSLAWITLLNYARHYSPNPDVRARVVAESVADLLEGAFAGVAPAIFDLFCESFEDDSMAALSFSQRVGLACTLA